MWKLSKCSVVFFLIAFLLAGCAGQKVKPNEDLEARIGFSGLDVDLDGNSSQDVQFGGHNATTAAGARTNLGLAIGTDVAAQGHNHSGTYELADATILKDADIGASVQAYSANLDSLSTPGAAGTYAKSTGSGITWDVAGGAGGGTIGGTLGSTDNVVPRVDGTGGLTLQDSLMTISDAGTPNIPGGQTYNINGSAHTHNYQAADADLTTWAGITPSANMQSMALLTYAQMLTALGAQATDADLTAIAGLSGVRGDIIYRDATQWQRLAKGTSGKVLKMGSDDPFWGDDNNDGGAGISTWDELGDAAADATIALAGYKTIWTSTLNSAGANFTLTNTTADLTADVSFFDLKYTDDGDANGFFMRGYDNAGNDLKWSIKADGAFTGYSFETAQAATGGVFDLLEGSGNGTNYIRFQAPDALASDYTITLPAVTGTMALVATTIPTTAVPWQRDIHVPAPAATDVVRIRTVKAITLSAIGCIVDPGGSGESVVVDLQECDANGGTCGSVLSATITCGNTNTTGTITDTAIAANVWILIDLGTVTGTVSDLSIYIRGTEAQ